MPNYQTNSMKRRSRPAWFRSIAARDREVVAAIKKWLQPVRWQWFVTLTFPWNVGEETAIKKLRKFADRLEKFSRGNICFVAGRESRAMQHGLNVPHHFHMLVTSRGPLTVLAIQTAWRGLVAPRGTKMEREDCIRVEVYDPDAPGAEYCLKRLNDDQSDWLTHRLEHFLPEAPGPSRPNHRTVRSAKRAKAQAARFGQKLPDTRT